MKFHIVALNLDQQRCQHLGLLLHTLQDENFHWRLKSPNSIMANSLSYI